MMLNEKTFQVPNMTCNGCRSTVTEEIEQIQGVKHVEATLATKIVKVEWDNPATWEQIAERLSAVNYPAVVD
jgi:copper chaperone